MSHYPSVEELIIDDSFINYCFQKNEADILYWEQYAIDYSFERKKIEEAKQIVLGLYTMLKQEHTESRAKLHFLREKDEAPVKVFPFKKIFSYAGAVAAVVIVILIGKAMIDIGHQKNNKTISRTGSDRAPYGGAIYTTANGEKKVITLSDNTKIWLNAGSELRIDEKYGIKSREVHLRGEALFDVVHDESLPFVVHTDKYEVKDLGTVFNVKAYPDDKQSETVLIKGKVEIHVTNSMRKILLSPNQKAVINESGEFRVKEKETPVSSDVLSVTLLPLSYNQKDSAVIETAWSRNRLEIVNENFYEMKEKLERWFNVKISIEDSEVGKYPFTATFEKENIQQVLQALQYAYHFNYKIENNEVNISK